MCPSMQELCVPLQTLIISHMYVANIACVYSHFPVSHTNNTFSSYFNMPTLFLQTLNDNQPQLHYADLSHDKTKQNTLPPLGDLCTEPLQYSQIKQQPKKKKSSSSKPLPCDNIPKPPSAGGKHQLGTIIYHTIYVHEGIVHPFYSTTILVLDKQPHPCNVFLLQTMYTRLSVNGFPFRLFSMHLHNT